MSNPNYSTSTKAHQGPAAQPQSSSTSLSTTQEDCAAVWNPTTESESLLEEEVTVVEAENTVSLEPTLRTNRALGFNQNHSLDLTFESPSSTGLNFDTTPASFHPYLPSTFSASSPTFQSPSSIPSSDSSPSGDQEKALFLRHWTNILSKWFDVCDPELHFARVVPIQALTSQTLMKAISASSAWHLNRLGKFDRERSNHLYQDCLDHLIQAMNGPAVGSDDALLVAAVIMHHVEELRDLEHTLNLESRGHLIAMQVFLDSQDSTIEPTSLRTAAFRTAHREELHLSFVDQQQLMLPAEAAKIDRGLTRTDDDTWTWRIILLFKDSLSFSLSPTSADEWDTIWQNVQSWRNLRPITFDPTFCRAATPQQGKTLPEIWYLYDCHTYGAIHYHLCCLVLATSNPRTPKFGWNKTAAVKRIEDEVKASIIEICGIAISNQAFPPGMTAATAVITIFAETVTEPALQKALFDILIQTRKLHAWPTEAAQRYVNLIWQDQRHKQDNSPAWLHTSGIAEH